MNQTLWPIGHIISSLKTRKQCPRQYTENAPEAFAHIDAAYAAGLDKLQPGSDILVLTWLHESDRSILSCHPRGDRRIPQKGIFTTRSPDRPNPIGLHHTRILGILKQKDGIRLHLSRMEALDGTPVVDIKPAGHESESCGNAFWGSHIPAATGQDIHTVCHAAWQYGLFAGHNGNISVRLTDTVLITRSGVSKRDIGPDELTSLDLATGHVLGPGTASSESSMHLEIYKSVPAARCILHTHPPHLLALELKTGKTDLSLPLYEAEHYAAQLCSVPPLAPGSAQLARAVAQAAQKTPAVYMQQHGLTVHHTSLSDALALSETLDALARLCLV